MTTGRFRAGVAALTIAVGVAACTPPPEIPPGSPTDADLRGATYHGIDVQNPVTLSDGAWVGPPRPDGGADRAAVRLVADFRPTGDLDGDGVDEVVVLLAATGGGSGSRLYAAVVGHRAGAVRNLATTLLGDRVQVRAGRIDDRTLTLDLVTHGSGDPACCPGDLVRTTWSLEGDSLHPQDRVHTGRLSPAALTGEVWMLRYWRIGEPLQADLEVTVEFGDTRISGRAACNRYSGPVTATEVPGGIAVGMIATTRMACPDTAMAAEARFLALLGNVTTMGFLAGRLTLGYVDPDSGTQGTMLLERDDDGH